MAHFSILTDPAPSETKACECKSAGIDKEDVTNLNADVQTTGNLFAWTTGTHDLIQGTTGLT